MTIFCDKFVFSWNFRNIFQLHNKENQHFINIITPNFMNLPNNKKFSRTPIKRTQLSFAEPQPKMLHIYWKNIKHFICIKYFCAILSHLKPRLLSILTYNKYANPKSFLICFDIIIFLLSCAKFVKNWHILKKINKSFLQF